MVRLIMGANGAGKTKQLIDLIHNAVEAENGSVVCMEPSADMTYNISYNVRLVNASEYSVDSFECLRGFISGLYAGNYDISHVFVDNLCSPSPSGRRRAWSALPSVPCCAGCCRRHFLPAESRFWVGFLLYSTGKRCMINQIAQRRHLI